MDKKSGKVHVLIYIIKIFFLPSSHALDDYQIKNVCKTYEYRFSRQGKMKWKKKEMKFGVFKLEDWKLKRRVVSICIIKFNDFNDIIDAAYE